MRFLPLLVACALLGGASAPARAADAYRVVDAFEDDGAYSLIIVPENWNGSLIVYAHGYDPDHRNRQPFPSDITPANIGQKLGGANVIVTLPLAQGFAVGTTTYRSVGWAVGDAWRDLENVRQRFRKTVGRPKRTYVWGHSEGGIVTQTLIEKRPNAYDGALAMCAPGAGARRNLNGAWDLRAAYEYACAGVPDAEFRCDLCSDGATRCLDNADCPGGQTCGGAEPAYPPQWGLTAECTEFLLQKPGAVNESPRYGDFVNRHTEACFGGTNATPEQQARRDLFLRGTRIPESFLFTDLFFASIALGEIRNRRTDGGVPWSNAGVAYASPALSAAELTAFNAGVPRATNDRAATAFLRRSYEPVARTSTKVLTLHALDDGLVLPQNEEKYREAFRAADREAQLVQLYTDTGGHCGFSLGEHAASLDALVGWVERRETPTVAAVQAACTVIGGTCRIQDADPGVWGERVIERRQRGVAVGSLTCDGDPEDCPENASCASGREHCAGR